MLQPLQKPEWPGCKQLLQNPQPSWLGGWQRPTPILLLLQSQTETLPLLSIRGSIMLSQDASRDGALKASQYAERPAQAQMMALKALELVLQAP